MPRIDSLKSDQFGGSVGFIISYTLSFFLCLYLSHSREYIYVYYFSLLIIFPVDLLEGFWNCISEYKCKAQNRHLLAYTYAYISK